MLLTVICFDILGAEFDYLESSLEKFDDGPFFLGQFSQVSPSSHLPITSDFHCTDSYAALRWTLLTFHLSKGFRSFCNNCLSLI